MDAITNNKDKSDNEKIQPEQRVTTVEKKMDQMKETLKKYPIPQDMIKKM
ncbi:hypothetical protein [Dyadobacter sp. 3J3]|nr:hypothetical protein [Dyadobacter sp. 3J3]